MKPFYLRKSRIPFFLVSLILFLYSLPLKAAARKISADEYRARRANLIKLADDSSAVVLKSAESKMRSADVAYRYRQESNFLYLTGIDEFNCYMILVPRGITVCGKKVNYILFKPGIAGDTLLHESEALVNSSKFGNIFKSLLPGLNKIYTIESDVPFNFDWLNGRTQFLDSESKKYFESRHPGIKIKNASPVISRLREIKSQGETALISNAVKITGEALEKAAKFCRPGSREYVLRGAIEGRMLKDGSDYPAFPSIIGSGENSLSLHYSKDDGRMHNGDIVVIDIGAEYQGYASDITRTFPVSGKFSKAQKKIYGLVLEAQKKVIEAVKPGTTFYQLNKKALEVFAGKGLQGYMPHGVSHSVGLDVHDVTSSDTLRTGMVITVEPGLYFPKEDTAVAAEYRGFGIRIEDDILVTPGGCKVLSGSIPKEIADVEKLFLLNDE